MSILVPVHARHRKPNRSGAWAWSKIKGRGFWLVKVCLQDPRTHVVEWWEMGPLGSWRDARRIAMAWERDHGAGTTQLTHRRPGDDGRYGPRTPAQLAPRIGRRWAASHSI